MFDTAHTQPEQAYFSEPAPLDDTDDLKNWHPKDITPLPNFPENEATTPDEHLLRLLHGSGDKLPTKEVINFCFEQVTLSCDLLYPILQRDPLNLLSNGPLVTFVVKEMNFKLTPDAAFILEIGDKSRFTAVYMGGSLKLSNGAFILPLLLEVEKNMRRTP